MRNGRQSRAGDLAAAGRADLQQELDDQRLDDDGAEPCLFERLRLGGVIGVAAEQRLQEGSLAEFCSAGCHEQG